MNYYYKYLKYKKKYFELLNKNKEINKEVNKEINKEIINIKDKLIENNIFNKKCFITKFHIDNIFLPF